MRKELNIQDLLEETSKEEKASIELSEKDDAYTSTNFSDQKNLLKSLMNVQSTSEYSLMASKLEEPIKLSGDFTSIGSDRTIIYSSWKNIENISARLIAHFDEIVILECLVDRELKIYEEREFRASLFSDYDLKIGGMFYLRFFDRKNETRMEIHNDINLNFEEDFPKLDFTDLFKKSKLFKK